MICLNPTTAYMHKFKRNDNGKRILRFSFPIDIEDYDVVELPCGQCENCRVNYSSEWAMRIALESSMYENNYFVTLTYDDLHLPISELLDESTGEVMYVPSLVPDHFTKFMKDLRYRLSEDFDWSGVRFFGAGEYGDISQRPHYHIILLNMPELSDLEFYKASANYEPLYISRYLESIWKKGFITVGKVTFQSAAYTAKYTVKSLTNTDIFQRFGLQKPFVRMSRRPGIGQPYFVSNMDHLLESGKMVLYLPGKSPIEKDLPRYFEKLIDNQFPGYLDERSDKRIVYAKMKRVLMDQQTDLEYSGQLKARKALADTRRFKISSI